MSPKCSPDWRTPQRSAPRARDARGRRTFKQRASIALKDVTLQASLGKLTREGLVVRRAKAIAEFPEFQALREEGRRIKDHVLAHLDFYLERYEAEVTKAGGKVHWARDAEEARTIVVGLCRAANAKTVARGKSMVGEEIGSRRCARGRRPPCRRNRPRRIHHPARARAAQPHHRAGRAQDEGAGRPALRGRAPRAGHRRRTRHHRRAGGRGAAGAARGVLRAPMSASPAPTS